MIRLVKGMRDLYGAELQAWHAAEEVFRNVSLSFGYSEFRTPIVEYTELFRRGVGEETDIVGKEMYTFDDRGGDSITLRPEMTAPIVRAAIEYNVVRHSPVSRLWYYGPLFRYERPQKGRYRQFHQYGAECIGSAFPEADAEIITLANDVLAGIGVKDYRLEINSLGSPESRAAYRAALVAYLEQHRDALSEDSQRRIGTNPLRVLDSKVEGDRTIVAGAPKLHDYFDADSAQHFATVCSILDASGIAYTINPTLVRGLDYYSHTVFEFTTNRLGSQNAICGGGRYDPLFAILGGKDVPAVGFSFGVERVLMLLEEEQGPFATVEKPDAYVVALDHEARLPAQLIAVRLRRSGFGVVTDLLRRAQKGQMKEADRLEAAVAISVSSENLANGAVTLKNLQNGSEEQVAVEDIEAALTAIGHA